MSEYKRQLGRMSEEMRLGITLIVLLTAIRIIIALWPITGIGTLAGVPPILLGSLIYNRRLIERLRAERRAAKERTRRAAERRPRVRPDERARETAEDRHRYSTPGSSLASRRLS